MKDHDYITCRELIDFLGDFIDGSLPDAMRREFARHLAVCPSCVAYVDGYKQAIRLGKLAMQRSDEPAPVPEALVRAIRTARARAG